MAEGTYEYEVMRANLLGEDPPNYDDFMRRKAEEESASRVEADEVDSRGLSSDELQETLDVENEQLHGTSGKLDELNNILAETQKKINRFKIRCGSVTDLIKTKIKSISGTAEQQTAELASEAATEAVGDQVAADPRQEPEGAASIAAEPHQNGMHERKSQLSQALDNHVDRLDSMLDKAEQAEHSMRTQNKEMKRFLH